MSALPTKLYNVAQIRLLEKKAFEQDQLADITLMNRAGEAAFKAFRSVFPKSKNIVVICGNGNNGGDGYVFARFAHQHDYHVTVYHIGVIEALKSPAKEAYEACKKSGVNIQPFTSDVIFKADVIIDAILGIGLSKDVRGLAKIAIEKINAPVFALDVPSGLNADTGCVMGIAVKARYTITFLALKQGLFTHQSTEYCGTLLFDDLGVSTTAKSSGIRLNETNLVSKKRRRDSFKGDYGHVLVVGGDYGMPGAVRMAAEAALRVGAGLVTVATRPEHIAAVVCGRPEIMCHGIHHAKELKPLLERATVIVVGPGLGDSTWSSSLFKAILQTKLPMVVDACALSLLAKKPQHRENWILTPHPGEAGKLLGISAADIQKDRFKSLNDLYKRYGGAIVLKGAGSLIKSSEDFYSLSPTGNPGMGSGGMGDVLSGILGGVLAQRFGLKETADLGVFIHGLAADMAAATHGERGLLASDLYPFLQPLMNPKK